MGDLSPHFSRWEFECPDGCGKDTVDAELILVLEEIRVHFDKVVTVTDGGGARCKAYNDSLDNASPTSKHMDCKAADIKIIGVKPMDICRFLRDKYPDTYGIGEYSTWTHIDVRPEKARWTK